MLSLFICRGKRTVIELLRMIISDLWFWKQEIDGSILIRQLSKIGLIGELRFNQLNKDYKYRGKQPYIELLHLIMNKLCKNIKFYSINNKSSITKTYSSRSIYE